VTTGDANAGPVSNARTQGTPDRNERLWRAFIEALGAFVRVARRELGMKEGVKCPRCGHQH
jgi:hypothetical protein